MGRLIPFRKVVFAVRKDFVSRIVRPILYVHFLVMRFRRVHLSVRKDFRKLFVSVLKSYLFPGRLYRNLHGFSKMMMNIRMTLQGF